MTDTGSKLTHSQKRMTVAMKFNINKTSAMWRSKIIHYAYQQ